MTLSFITRWRDELPETYTALSPTPLNNARLIWHNTELANTLSIPSSLFKMAQVSGAAKPYCWYVTTGAGLQWSSVWRLGGPTG